jgi:hypothetical protein
MAVLFIGGSSRAAVEDVDLHPFSGHPNQQLLDQIRPLQPTQLAQANGQGLAPANVWQGSLRVA